MSLFQAYMATGGTLVVLGLLFAFLGEKFARMGLNLSRSRAAAIVLWGGALVWFVWHLMTISEVDLAGFPRSWLLVLFGGAGLLAFKFLPDLLPFRGLAVLALFSCSELLDAGFGQLPYSRILAGTAYVVVVAALWVGAAPYALRDALSRIENSTKVRVFVATGLLLVGVANLVAGLFWLPKI